MRNIKKYMKLISKFIKKYIIELGSCSVSSNKTLLKRGSIKGQIEEMFCTVVTFYMK